MSQPSWQTNAQLDDWDRYFELFNLAPVGYALLDPAGMIREVNQAAARLLEGTSAWLVGHPLVTFVARANRTDFLEHMRRVRHRQEVVEGEMDLVTRTGRIVPVHLSTRQSPRRDQSLCWTVIVDLTERQRLEEARRLADTLRDRVAREQVLAKTRNDAKDRFIATLSHELRNPLAPALYATAHLASLADLPESARPVIAMIRRNIEFEARLIDDLLDVTRIDQGKMFLDRRMIDVHAVLTDCLTACRGLAQAKPLTVTTDFRAGQATVRADALRLRQVVSNLLSNAIKFTPPNGRITVSTVNDEEGAIRISIADTGIGIDPQAIGGLFVAFEQAARREHGGLGLGLAISRGIVDAHGGRLWATSPGLGEGSTFEVELATDAEPVPASPFGERRRPNGRPSRILIVEDHPDAAAMLQTSLGLEGHHVEVALTLADGLVRIAEPWDLVISDLSLPDGSGLDLARRARALPTSPTRMVALSGFGSAADRAASQLAGFDDHLTKPVLPQALLNLLP